MNRGLAKRTVFETQEDVRWFLARLAWRVHAEELELHAYCILTTHFHLLVRSPNGGLSESLRRVQNEYTRWFDRTRRRDGPLFRGRFRSRPVRTLAYRKALVRYIDFNPVHAGLVAQPALHPHGSARNYAMDTGPIWLERSWVEAFVSESSGGRRYAPHDYVRVFGAPISPEETQWLERRLLGARRGLDPLDDLIDAAAPRVAEWMQRKAELADGTSVGLPITSEERVLSVLEAARSGNPLWRTRSVRKLIDAWPIARTGLLRDLCGSTLRDIASRVGCTTSAIWKQYQRHRSSLTTDEDYARRIDDLGRLAVRSQAVFSTDTSGGTP